MKTRLNLRQNLTPRAHGVTPDPCAGRRSARLGCGLGRRTFAIRRPLASAIAGALLVATVACADPGRSSNAPHAGGDEVRSEEVTFTSHATKLAGTLVRPGSAEVSAAVVFVHGSGPQERNRALAEAFATRGIAALVYDKRGVGESDGEYEAKQSVSGPNISLLADDAVAALQELSRRVRAQGIPVGLAGISQAGWIVPLAAERSSLAEFLVIWSGPVCKVSEEDIYSKYTSDRDTDEVPSYEEALGSRQEPYIWPDFLGTDTDPAQSLGELSLPGLWIFGAEDGSVPVDLSIQRLDALRKQGLPYEYVLFSDLGHNNMGETFSTAISWIKRQDLNRSAGTE
ncbi:MAG: alpha/beta hydrolase [Acidobacteriota bacterium]